MLSRKGHHDPSPRREADVEAHHPRHPPKSTARPPRRLLIIAAVACSLWYLCMQYMVQSHAPAAEPRASSDLDMYSEPPVQRRPVPAVASVPPAAQLSPKVAGSQPTPAVAAQPPSARPQAVQAGQAQAKQDDEAPRCKSDDQFTDCAADLVKACGRWRNLCQSTCTPGCDPAADNDNAAVAPGVDCRREGRQSASAHAAAVHRWSSSLLTSSESRLRGLRRRSRRRAFRAGHFRDTSETPPRHLRDTSETPPRHLRDTSETLSAPPCRPPRASSLGSEPPPPPSDAGPLLHRRRSAAPPVSPRRTRRCGRFSFYFLFIAAGSLDSCVLPSTCAPLGCRGGGRGGGPHTVPAVPQVAAGQQGAEGGARQLRQVRQAGAEPSFAAPLLRRARGQAQPVLERDGGQRLGSLVLPAALLHPGRDTAETPRRHSPSQPRSSPSQRRSSADPAQIQSRSSPDPAQT